MSITIRPGRRLTASSNAALRNPVITGKSDQLLDVAILVILKLGGIRKIMVEGAPLGLPLSEGFSFLGTGLT